jgi:hypothetical protein
MCVYVYTIGMVDQPQVHTDPSPIQHTHTQWYDHDYSECELLQGWDNILDLCKDKASKRSYMIYMCVYVCVSIQVGLPLMCVCMQIGWRLLVPRIPFGRLTLTYLHTQNKNTNSGTSSPATSRTSPMGTPAGYVRVFIVSSHTRDDTW